MKTTVWLALPPPGAESGANVTDWEGGGFNSWLCLMQSVGPFVVSAYHAMPCRMMLAHAPLFVTIRHSHKHIGHLPRYAVKRKRKVPTNSPLAATKCLRRVDSFCTDLGVKKPSIGLSKPCACSCLVCLAEDMAGESGVGATPLIS